jgi:hypothetical protein
MHACVRPCVLMLTTSDVSLTSTSVDHLQCAGHQLRHAKAGAAAAAVAVAVAVAAVCVYRARAVL